MAVVTGQAVVLKGINGLSILLGSGPPDSTVGVDGQPGYLDTQSNLLYGPRVAGAWPTAGFQFGGNLLMYVGKPPDSFGALGNLSLDIGQGFIYGPRSATSWPAQPLLALVGPQGIPGPTGPASPVNNDPSLNSLILSPVAGDNNPVQIAIKNSAGALLWGVDTNGNQVVGGTLNVTGNATFNSAVTAGATTVTSLANSGNQTVAGTMSVTGVSTLGSAKVVQVTFPDNSVQSTAFTGAANTATASRSILDLGSYANTNTTANAYWTTNLCHFNNTAVNATPLSVESLIRTPFPYTITGWTMIQYVANGTNSFQLTKNRTSGSMNNFVTVTAGSATVSGFPGNQFSGTFTKGTYNFAAGDSLGAVVQFTTGTSTNCHLWLYVEWL